MTTKTNPPQCYCGLHGCTGGVLVPECGCLYTNRDDGIHFCQRHRHAGQPSGTICDPVSASEYRAMAESEAELRRRVASLPEPDAVRELVKACRHVSDDLNTPTTGLRHVSCTAWRELEAALEKFKEG